MGPRRALVEYYSARGRIYACVITEDSVNVRPLAVAGHVKNLVQRLQFQLSKFQLPESYLENFEASINDATLMHLKDLHEALFAPLASELVGRELVIVPHGFLHYLPFHALHDGDKYVIDDFSVSYAPSASVFVHCDELPPVETG